MHISLGDIADQMLDIISCLLQIHALNVDIHLKTQIFVLNLCSTYHIIEHDLMPSAFDKM